LEKLLNQLPFEEDDDLNEANYRRTVHDFLYHALWAIKKIRRGELWAASDCNNQHLKDLTAKLLAWDAQLQGRRDTWHDGRFIHEWADRETYQRVAATFSDFDPERTRAAILRGVEVAEVLSSRIGVRAGFASLQDQFAVLSKIVSDNGL
jgi:aminoglycoside 6-adenylyltransferase